MRQIISIIAISLIASVACGGMQAPRKLVAAATGGGGLSDSFTGTDDTPLATHDSNWVNANSTYTVANLEIISNTVRPTGVWNTAGARYTGGGDISQIVYKGGRSGDGSIAYAAVRMNGTTLGYGCYLDGASGGNWTGLNIQKNGNWMENLTTGTWSQSADHTIRVRASGTSPVTIYCSIDGGAEYSVTDSTSPYTTGLPGFVAYPDGTMANAVFDDWSGQ